MRVLVTGGTGMIGKALVGSLLADGHEAVILTRSPEKVRLPSGARAAGWDGRTASGWGGELEHVDAVVNLVGERLSKWPWTRAQKQRFWQSRVDGGRALVEAISAASHRPAVLVQASGINYYGPRGVEPVTEADERGHDFLSDLSEAWESSTAPVEALGLRRVVTRSGIVLNAREGILPIMALPVRLFAGGPLGSGRQGLPWIHQADEVGAIRFLLENEAARGPFNLVSPEPISSAEFIRELARALKRPYWLRAPAFALRLALGEMSTLILDGLYPLSKRLQELGYRFRFPAAAAALHDLLAA